MTTSANRFRFRAWLLSTKEMADVGGWHDDANGRLFSIYRHDSCDNTETYEVDPMTGKADLIVMQSTGMADRLGNEIWEGDLLQDETHDKPVVEVRWWPEAMRFQCFRGESPWEVYFDGTWPRRLMAQVVIGNKFQHPEILERKG